MSIKLLILLLLLLLMINVVYIEQEHKNEFTACICVPLCGSIKKIIKSYFRFNDNIRIT